MAPPPGMGEGNRGCPGFPLLSVSPPNAILWGLKSPLPPPQHPTCPEASCVQPEVSPGPVGCEHHGATRFDDIQDEVPEEAPCLGVHPCSGLILQDRQHPQTCQPPGRPCHPLLTVPHPRTLVAEPGAGSSQPGSFLHPSPVPAPGTRWVSPTVGRVLEPRAHQEDEGWVSDQRDGCGQLPLVASAVGAGGLVGVLGQLQLLQCPLDHLQGMGGCCHPAKAMGLAELAAGKWLGSVVWASCQGDHKQCASKRSPTAVPGMAMRVGGGL